jgi:hypothetical protein
MPPAPTPQRRLGLALIANGKQEILVSKNLDAAATSLGQIAPRLKQDGRIATSMSDIEDGTRSVRDLLKPVAQMLHFVATKLDQIKVPHLDIATRRINIPVVGRVRVVTGVSINQKWPFRDLGVVGAISGTADDVDNIRKALKAIANGIRDVHTDLPIIRANIVNGSKSGKRAAANLNRAGTRMVAAGHILAP